MTTNLGSATADDNGVFSITSSTLTDGTYSLTATATDSAGNISSSSAPFTLQVGLTDFEALNYIASHEDLINALSTDITAAKSHYTNYGNSEGRSLDNFDEWGYLASNIDLMKAFGSNTTKALKHYINFGKSEGRSINSFNAESYLNNNSDLRNAFGNNHDSAIKHFVEFGFNEGREF